MLDPVIHKMIKYVQNLEEKDLKDKVRYSHSVKSAGEKHWFPGVECRWEASEGSRPCLLVTSMGFSEHLYR